MSFHVRQSSVVAASKEEVWAAISTMAGVNHELSPWLRMTHPANALSLASGAPVGQRLFRSVILLLGFLPIDLHGLKLDSVEPGTGFHENSRTLMQKQWKHTRTLEAVGENRCRVNDAIEFEPWLPLVGHVVRPVVKLIFTWRHQRLAERFGSAEG